VGMVLVNAGRRVCGMVPPVYLSDERTSKVATGP
jgi:hypothetical protein